MRSTQLVAVTLIVEAGFLMRARAGRTGRRSRFPPQL